MMNNLMIDIETLGTEPNSVILEIAAATFDFTGMTGAVYSQRINVKKSLELGLEIDADTLKWWFKTNPKLLADYILNDGHTDVHWVANNFRQFVDKAREDSGYPVKPFYVWMNSPSFDGVILKNAFKKTGVSFPWNFNEERDYRSLVNLPVINPNELDWPDPDKSKDHQALPDCLNQIKILCQAVNQIDGGIL